MGDAASAGAPAIRAFIHRSGLDLHDADMLTPEEQRRVFWDISWIWGPPEDHLAKLFRTMGAERFVFGTQWPLRLTQTPRANLDLLPDDVRGATLADADSFAR